MTQELTSADAAEALELLRATSPPIATEEPKIWFHKAEPSTAAG